MNKQQALELVRIFKEAQHQYEKRADFVMGEKINWDLLEEMLEAYREEGKIYHD